MKTKFSINKDDKRIIIKVTPKESSKVARIIQKEIKKRNEKSYIVAQQKYFFLKKLTVIDELKKATGSMESALEYASERNLTYNRLSRPIDKLSAEKWRAGVAIGLLYKAQNFIFRNLSREYYEKYKHIFFMDLFNDIWNCNGRVIIISEDLEEI